MVSATTAHDAGPPAVLRLLAHPVRWRVLQALVESDRTVRELTAFVDAPQSLVSYHLRQLHDGELVVRHPSAADARDTYYALDLGYCRRALRDSVDALHPGLWPVEPADAPAPAPSGRPRRVLFLCTGNSARSQMAEALLEHMTQGTVRAASAGSHPKPLHPNAVRVMQRRGIDISGARPKPIDEVATQRFDVAITLCDRVREVCPELPSHPRRVHWSIPDPARAGSTLRASRPAFERTAAELEARIGFFLDRAGRRTRRPNHPTKTTKTTKVRADG